MKIYLSKLLKKARFFLEKFRPDSILIIFIILASIKFVFSIESIEDIRLADESDYLYKGVNLTKHGLAPAEWGPLYSVWYYLLSVFVRNNVELYYLNYKILIILTTAALYIYLRRIKITYFISIVVSILYLISGAHLIQTWVSHFALLILFTFLIWGTFVKNQLTKYCLIGFGILMVSYIRPEFFISFLIFFILFFCVISKIIIFEKNPKIINFGRVGLFLTFILLTIFFLGNPLSGNRSWIAFGQHFSVNYVKWNNMAINPFTNWEGIVNSVYGNKHNIISAVMINPWQFLKHVFSNAGNCIPEFLNNLLADFEFLPRFLNKVLRLSEISVFIFTGLYLFKKRGEIRKIFKDNGSKEIVVLFMIINIVTFVVILVIYPRSHYMILGGAMLLVLVSYLVSEINKNITGKPSSLMKTFLIGLFILVLIPSLAIGWKIIPVHLEAKEGDRHIDVIKFVQSLNIATPINMLEADGGYFIYLTDNYKRIPEWEKKEPFCEFILCRNINMVVFSEDLANDIRFNNDDEFKAFLINPQMLGFIKVEIPNCRVKCLFIKNNLYRKRSV